MALLIGGEVFELAVGVQPAEVVGELGERAFELAVQQQNGGERTTGKQQNEHQQTGDRNQLREVQAYRLFGLGFTPLYSALEIDHFAYCLQVREKDRENVFSWLECTWVFNKLWYVQLTWLNNTSNCLRAFGWSASNVNLVHAYCANDKINELTE